MIARGGIHIATISGLILLVSACAAPQTPPLQNQATAPAIAPPVMPSGEGNAASPPPAGADELYFRAEYGPPDFVRDENESQLWRYDGSECSFFVFLYEEGGSYVLRHAQTNPPGVGGSIDTDCLSSIKSARNPTS